MKIITLLFSLLFLTSLNARVDGDGLNIEREGLIIVVIDFEEGDKIKLFEVETGDHILSKTRGQIDLSQLPSGKYLLENNKGESVVIEKTDTDIFVEEELGTDYIVAKDSEYAVPSSISVEEQLENFYVASELDPLYINREGDIITVIDFEEGDLIKLFEIKNTVHVLSKTVGTVDLSQLPVGKYVLENNKGQSTIIEKFEEKEEEYVVAYN